MQQQPEVRRAGTASKQQHCPKSCNMGLCATFMLGRVPRGAWCFSKGKRWYGAISCTTPSQGGSNGFHCSHVAHTSLGPCESVQPADLRTSASPVRLQRKLKEPNPSPCSLCFLSRASYRDAPRHFLSEVGSCCAHQRPRGTLGRQLAGDCTISIPRP